MIDRDAIKKLSDEEVLRGARDERNPYVWDYRKEAERRRLTFFARTRKR